MTLHTAMQARGKDVHPYAKVRHVAHLLPSTTCFVKLGEVPENSISLEARNTFKTHVEEVVRQASTQPTALASNRVVEAWRPGRQSLRRAQGKVNRELAALFH